MDDNIEKKYYTPTEAGDILGVYASSIRFWDDLFHIIKVRGRHNNTRKITIENIKTFTKIKLLMNFMNKEGVKQVLKGKIQVSVDNEVLKTYS